MKKLIIVSIIAMSLVGCVKEPLDPTGDPLEPIYLKVVAVDTDGNTTESNTIKIK